MCILCHSGISGCFCMGFCVHFGKKLFSGLLSKYFSDDFWVSKAWSSSRCAFCVILGFRVVFAWAFAYILGRNCFQVYCQNIFSDEFWVSKVWSASKCAFCVILGFRVVFAWDFACILGRNCFQVSSQNIFSDEFWFPRFACFDICMLRHFRILGCFCMGCCVHFGKKLFSGLFSKCFFR